MHPWLASRVSSCGRLDPQPAILSRRQPHGKRVAHSQEHAMPADGQSRFPQAAYIDPTARLYGSVEIGEHASLWPYAVVRAESRFVRVGAFTNLQDHVMVHVGY